MPMPKLEWEEVPTFVTLAQKLIEKYPEHFNGIDPEWFVAYGCINRDKPEKKKNSLPYDMTGEVEPMSFTNSKKYFVTFYMSDWDGRDEEGRLWIVFSALKRVDKEHPDSGKVEGFDYKDQGELVRTLGADWYNKSGLPHLLKDSVALTS